MWISETEGNHGRSPSSHFGTFSSGSGTRATFDKFKVVGTRGKGRQLPRHRSNTWLAYLHMNSVHAVSSVDVNLSFCNQQASARDYRTSHARNLDSTNGI